MLFLQFFPEADESLAQQFSANVATCLAGRDIAMAGLQHYFIAQRKATAEEAASATAVAAIATEMDRRAEEKAEVDEKAEKTGEAKKKKAEDTAAASSGGGDAAAEQVHVHIHTE